MGNQISSLRKPAAVTKVPADAEAANGAGGNTAGDMNNITMQSADIEQMSASLVAAATSASASMPASQSMDAADLRQGTRNSSMAAATLTMGAAFGLEGTALVATATSTGVPQPASQLINSSAADLELGASASSLVAAATPARASQPVPQPMGAAADLKGFSTSVVALATPASRASQPRGTAGADLEETSAALVTTTPARAPQQTPQPISVSGRIGQIVTPSTIVKDGDYKTATFHAREHFRYIMREAEHLLGSAEAPEEIRGSIRKIILKTTLVLRQLNDVEEMRKKNEKPGEADEFIIRKSDVAGVWDFTRILMEEVDNLFTELNAIKENEWQPLPEPADAALRQTPIRNSATRRPLFTPNPNSPVARRAQETRDKFIQKMRLQVLQKKKQQLEGGKGQGDTENEGQQPTSL